MHFETRMLLELLLREPDVSILVTFQELGRLEYSQEVVDAGASAYRLVLDAQFDLIANERWRFPGHAVVGSVSGSFLMWDEPYISLARLSSGAIDSQEIGGDPALAPLRPALRDCAFQRLVLSGEPQCEFRLVRATNGFEAERL